MKNRRSNSARALIFSLTLAIVSLSAASRANAEPFAYVANLGSSNVSVIDVATNSVIAIVPVGSAPSGVAITPDGAHAYVTNQSSGNVSVINTDSNTVIATIPVGAAPRGIAISQDGEFAYVSNANSNSVSVISIATNTVTASVNVGSTPLGIALKPNGAFAYVTNANSNSVSVIDTATNTVSTTVAVGTAPEGVVFAPNGAFAYVANQNSAEVSVIDTTTNTVVSTVTVGSTPVGIAITPDATFVYVTNGGTNNVSVIDTATNTVTGTLSVGGSPLAIAITPDGSIAYVSNFNSANVSVIDTATNSVTTTIAVGSNPFGVAITPRPQIKYRLTDLGTLGGNLSEVRAVNASGQVTGFSRVPGSVDFHAFLWTGVMLQDLGTLGGTYSFSRALNDAGFVTGAAQTVDGELHSFLWNGVAMQDLGTLGGAISDGEAINADGLVTGTAEAANGQSHAFRWDGTAMQDVGTFGGTQSYGRAINSPGQVTGDAAVANGDMHAFLWSGSTPQFLGTLGGTSSSGLAINDFGQITGVAQTASGHTHAFLWNGSAMQDLGTLGGANSSGNAINASGQVTGMAQAGSVEHVFRWNGSSMEDLGTLGGTIGVGLAINASGHVTGYSFIAANASQHAFLSDGGPMQDLNSLVESADPLQPYVTLYEGRDINDSGQIAANGIDNRTGQFRAYLVTPADLDTDGDTIPNYADNCPTVSNLDQTDTDEDGIGDVCDTTAADTTPPLIQSNVVGTLGDGGWYVSDVTVEWTVADAESAISTSEACDLTHVAGDTAGVTLTCTATSTGGTASEDVTVKRDETRPSVIATASPMPNFNGWNNTNVLVTYAGSDAMSGVASCDPGELLSSEGSNVGVHWGTCVDNAGNVSTEATAFPINIDKTAPIVTAAATPPPNGAGWNSTPVTVAFAGVDALSGVALDGCDHPFVVSSNGMGQGVSGRCFDRAGNSASTSYSGLNIDTTPPVAVASQTPAANINGWNNTNVTASWAGTDALSGSGVSSCSPNFLFSAEGSNQSTSGSCLDVAGLVSQLAVVAGVNIDKTAPTVPSIFVPVPNDGFVIGESPIANYSCADSLSTVATCTGPVASGAAIVTSGLGINPFGVTATDRAGNSRSAVGNYLVNPANTVIATTIAGNGTSGSDGDGGPSTSANLSTPAGLGLDAAGNLYIVDPGNNRIRKVTLGGTISTVAGNGMPGFSGDGGPATSARLSNPFDVVVDSVGNFYISDLNNNRVRRVTPAGVISTVAGNGTSGFGGDGGPATSAALGGPLGLDLDAAGNLYFAERDNNRIRKVTLNGTISTVAGNGTVGFSGDGGPATSASLRTPVGIAFDAAGNLYFADANNARVRKITQAGIISTVAGNGTSGFSGDNGPAISANLNGPHDVAADASGNLYIADYSNSRVRKVTPGGVISTATGNGTLAFGGDGGPATSASLTHPVSVKLDAAGKLYISDQNNYRVRRVRDTTYTLAPMAVFGTQALNIPSIAKVVTLTNRGPQPVSVTSISFTGANPTLFSQTNNCGIQTLQAVETACAINVVFRPTSNGAKSAVLNVNTAGGSGTKSVALSGTGGPTFALDPSTLAFGNQPVSLPTAAKSVIVTNTGTIALPISSISNVGNQFSRTTGCGTSVAAGASCTIDVVFLPTSVGAKTANLTVNAGGGAGSKSVSLTGTGTPPTYSLSPGSLAFNNQAVSVPNGTGIVTLTNTGAIPVPITSVNDTGSNANQFTESHNCGSSVAVGASCTITVTFLPTSAGAKLATMKVNAGGSAGTQSVALSGTGVVPAFSVTPAALAFGSQLRGTVSAAQIVTVTNTGTVQLPIASITRSGTNQNQFSHTSACSTPIAVGGSCTISVVFQPTNAGNKAATLNVIAGGGAGTKSVTLSGTGT